MRRAIGRPARRLRGWGGVTGMAAACAFTAAVTLLPLAHHDGGASGADLSGGGVATADRARAEACTEPEASLPPRTAAGRTSTGSSSAGS
ncbi:glutamate ABC transporter substrate-binding protein [Streptomyces californicus]